ncbi:MAG TPA: hypothetical protein VGN81_22435 [Pseudonocardiaceae bacterium]|jgi:hypothetical protein
MTYGPQPGWNPNQPPAGGQSGSRSPLVTISAAIALVLFVYLLYNAIILLVAQVTTLALDKTVYNTSFLFDVDIQIDWPPCVHTAVDALIAILWLIGGILLLVGKPAGRIVVSVMAVITICAGLVAIVRLPSWYVNLFVYLVPAVALVGLVLVLLPATAQALRR